MYLKGVIMFKSNEFTANCVRLNCQFTLIYTGIKQRLIFEALSVSSNNSIHRFGHAFNDIVNIITCIAVMVCITRRNKPAKTSHNKVHNNM